MPNKQTSKIISDISEIAIVNWNNTIGHIISVFGTSTAMKFVLFFIKKHTKDSK